MAVTAKSHKDVLLALHDDPNLFVSQLLKAEPQHWQANALNAIRDHDRVAIRSGHGVGKTALLSWLIIWWLLTHYPAKIACTANTSHQLSDVLWAEIQKWIKALPPGMQRQLEIKSDKIMVSADSFAVARTSRKEQPEALQGFHSDNMLFVLDEASGIPDVVFETGQGSMSTPAAKTIMVGNPTRATGFFADAFTSGRWQTMTVGCADSTTVSDEFVAEMAEQYGADSNIYRVRVLGLPPSDDDDVLIPLSLLEAAVERDVEPELVAPIWALDVARFGTDATALCKRRGNVITEKIRIWRNRDLMETCGAILTEYESTPHGDRPSEIIIDSIGLGAGVVDRLIELDLPARGVNVAETPALGQKFVRLRDELWFKGREWLERRDCQIPEDAALINELASVRYRYTSTGKLKIEGKDEMKKRGLKSPDRADAFLLTLAGQAVRAAHGSGYRWQNRIADADTSWVV